MANDPVVLAHKEWLGYVQPAGLVVSIPAMLEARAVINRNFGPDHARFLDALPVDEGEPVPEIRDFPEFTRAVLNWDLKDLWGSPEAQTVPDTLDAVLENYNETLRPTYALREYQPTDSGEWILLVQVLPQGTDLDAVADGEARQWQASPQARFERLLRQVHVPIGLLVNGPQIRLVYAPEKELSGHLTFNLRDMVQVAGRPIFAALQMLLCSERLYSLPENERLPAILANSRKYQNVVSTQLAGQVLEALYELLRGFQAADDAAHGELLRQVLARDPDHVYAGLLTTLLRLVFLLYAEDRGLLSTDPVYANYYSVTGLYERLRADAARYPDTMYQRYGAWAQLLALFRLIYAGGRHGGMRIPAREGYLFDPDRYLFLESRQNRRDDPVIPRVADGIVHKVLEKLLILDGERLSYRTLAVEQIGSVYEAIMGFQIQVAAGQSIAVKPAKKHGAPATINLDALLQVAPDKRMKWFADATDQKLTSAAAEGLMAAVTLNDLLVVLEKKIAKTVTPNVVPHGAMIFQPSNERRKSGSHYTPSTLTGPIVEAALAPVLKQLGDKPKPEQILNLKVCDPAMGSGAFLVEACRQLGDALSKAWHAHGEVPSLPPDEDEELHAQRTVAQRCLYGVDKNPLAADLAKLSLWLATLAKDHPFTFLDHSLRHGDSLVGLTRQQIATFHWLDKQSVLLDLERDLRGRIERISRYRQRILAARDSVPYSQLQQELDGAEQELTTPRLAGDAVIAAFFSGDKPRIRENTRIVLREQTEAMLKDATNTEAADAVENVVGKLQQGPKGIVPFHWELEFPEVFTVDKDGKTATGFDVIVGNPPFAGRNTLVAAHVDSYIDWLGALHQGANGNADLVAHFFRRAYNLLRRGGNFGLIATKTIAQGDTRNTGLRWICVHGGTIYQARRRWKWPGQAAVTVSIIHVHKGQLFGPFKLDNRGVRLISAFLFHRGGNEDPSRLKANRSIGFQGVKIYGQGFIFDDTDRKGEVSSLEKMSELIQREPRNKERIFPYLGGEEVNESPSHSSHRFVIDFEDWPLRRDGIGANWIGANETEQEHWLRRGVVPLDYPGPVAADWPDLLDIVTAKVKPYRNTDNRENYRRLWWQYGERRPGLKTALRDCRRAIVCCQTTEHLGFVVVPTGIVFSQKLIVFPTDSPQLLCLLQSRVHELWAKFAGSTLEDRTVYTPSDCFETFPLPLGYDSDELLGNAGSSYLLLRSKLMQQLDEGLTKVYNRFHNPEEESREIDNLRSLHNGVDDAVLNAFGWTDIQPKCEFIPEFEDEEDEDESGRPRRKKYRYRWPDEIRDEVLARLLDLNRQRALEEGQLTPEVPQPATGKDGTRKKKASRKGDDSEVPLFATHKGDT